MKYQSDNFFECYQFSMAFFSRPVKVHVQFLKSFGEAVPASYRGDISSLTLSTEVVDDSVLLP